MSRNLTRTKPQKRTIEDRQRSETHGVKILDYQKLNNNAGLLAGYLTLPDTNALDRFMYEGDSGQLFAIFASAKTRNFHLQKGGKKTCQLKTLLQKLSALSDQEALLLITSFSLRKGFDDEQFFTSTKLGDKAEHVRNIHIFNNIAFMLVMATRFSKTIFKPENNRHTSKRILNLTVEDLFRVWVCCRRHATGIRGTTNDSVITPEYIEETGDGDSEVTAQSSEYAG